jgi:hypothetical protein
VYGGKGAVYADDGGPAISCYLMSPIPLPPQLADPNETCGLKLSGPD